MWIRNKVARCVFQGNESFLNERCVEISAEEAMKFVSDGYYISGYDVAALRNEQKPKKHSHYHKNVSNLETIDVYQVCRLFELDDHSGALHHALKKILCPGKRGVKSRNQDIQEAIDSLKRYLEINS